MITIITKEQALQAMLDGKEEKGFIICDTIPQEEIDRASGGITEGNYQCRSISDALDEYNFFLVDIEPGETEPNKPNKSKKTRKTGIDVGKIIALHKAGRSQAWIANDMGISQATALKYIRQYHERGDNVEESEEKGAEEERP